MGASASSIATIEDIINQDENKKIKIYERLLTCSAPQSYKFKIDLSFDQTADLIKNITIPNFDFRQVVLCIGGNSLDFTLTSNNVWEFPDYIPLYKMRDECYIIIYENAKCCRGMDFDIKYKAVGISQKIKDQINRMQILKLQDHVITATGDCY